MTNSAMPSASPTVEAAAVIGAGTMGHGIAHALAAAGIRTRLFDVAPAAVEKGLASVRANLDKGVEKGKTTPAQRDLALARLSGTSDLGEAVAGVQVVIEAVPEDLALKQRIFADLGQRCGPDVLLASNTSSLPVSQIARATAHPER